MSDVYFPLDHTPEEWRAMAGDATRREHESFERCDTDGYLSQWASNRTASLYLLCASIAETGGEAEFLALAQTPQIGAAVELSDVIPNAREVKTRYGWAWAVWNADGTTSWFRPSEAKDALARRARDAVKGYLIVRVRQQAVVMMTGDSLLAVRPIARPRQNTVPTDVADTYYRDWDDAS